MSANELNLLSDEVADPEAFLATAEIELLGRLPWSSNSTFLVQLRADEAEHMGVYKPVAGERPLWDFSAGLDRRERAAYVVSELLGLGVVPPTVIRDGPHGPGSVQWFVDADHSQHYFTLVEAHPELADTFRRIAAFDVLINNTDRKSGHILYAHDRVWAIDNGLCFAAEEKLRTVIWDFAGEPIPDDLLDAVATFTVAMPEPLSALLDADEAEALAERAGMLVMGRTLPIDRTGRRYPWPLV